MLRLESLVIVHVSARPIIYSRRITSMLFDTVHAYLHGSIAHSPIRPRPLMMYGQTNQASLAHSLPHGSVHWSLEGTIRGRAQATQTESHSDSSQISIMRFIPHLSRFRSFALPNAPHRYSHWSGNSELVHSNIHLTGFPFGVTLGLPAASNRLRDEGLLPCSSSYKLAGWLAG